MAVTVAWTTSVLATWGAVLLWGVSWLLLPPAGLQDGKNSPLAVFPKLLLLIGAATGTVSLLLVPLVYRFRPSPPPKVITIWAILGGVTPWIIAWLRAT